MTPKTLDASAVSRIDFEKALSESPKNELNEWIKLNSHLIAMGDQEKWINAVLKRKDNEGLRLLVETHLFDQALEHWLVQESSIMQIKNVKRVIQAFPAVLTMDHADAPLFHHGHRNQLSMVELFLEAGADPYRIDEEGYNLGQSLFLNLADMCDEEPTTGLEKKLLDLVLKTSQKYPNLIHPYRMASKSREFFPLIEWSQHDIHRYMWTLKWAIEHLGWTTESSVSLDTTWRQTWEENGTPTEKEMMIELLKFELDLHLPQAQITTVKNRL